MQSSHSRPIGPRSNPRSQSPAPPALGGTRPLQIRKVSNDPSPSPSLHPPSPPLPSLSSSPVPSRPHLPGLSLPRPNGSKPLLRLPMAGAYGASYYQGPPTIPLELNSENPGVLTVRPETVAQTPKPNEAEKPDNSIAQLVAVFDKASLDTYSANEESVAYGATKWSDGVLEELDRLGEGQGGAVHKVRDKRSNFIMARKTITTREAPLKQLERELFISSTTKHVNIIRFYGAYMSPSSSEVKVVMEYCPGKSLEAVGKRIKDRGGRISEKVAGRLAEGVLQGLAYLYSLKTIHRDIKPSNILLTGEGIVKLCDFGVSGELVRSLAGTFTGTSFYMAPERISGKEYSIRADVWSTGITLLELVQNRYPFPDDLTPIELLVHITTGEPPQLTDEADVRWSNDMKDFIKQTLIVDDHVRPPPKEMLTHPWVTNIMKQEVPMARWIGEVWGWPRPQNRAKEASRPGSSRGVGTPPPRVNGSEN